jgi:ABC-type transport system substrate-binding protein
MQLALNRPLILDAVYSGRGLVVDGIYPNGLIGYDPDIPQIPYDVEEAKKLMAKAGYPDGFDLTISMNATATEYDMNVMRIAAYMWEKIGIKTKITVLPTSDFLKQRGSGKLACYIATWTADYDDPYNFINTFFGTEENTRYRSINYYNTDVMDRIQKVKAVPNRNERLAEYQALERTVVQDDAAWIPLYSREHAYLKSDRVESMAAAWNGSVKTLYREVSLKKTAGEEAAK